MPTDVEIAQSAKLRPIAEVAEQIGLGREEIEPFGRFKAKVRLEALARRADGQDGRLIMVTAMTPTPLGEGKTLTTVGLGQALARLGKRSAICVREPSLGPVFGIKGGATGGGRSQLLPMEDINLHFTGDIHAVTAAHNLLAAMLDAHVFHGNELDIDVNQTTWQRVLDINDRALRNVIVGLGGKAHGIPRQDGFKITAASEIMAVLCLAGSMNDLKERLRRIVVGYSRKGTPVTAGDLRASGAMALLLKEALKPNLVQSFEHTPAFVHGGPFANIAHGTNSILADRLALKLSDVVVTEAGFGSDLGAEKFFNITARAGRFTVNAVILVATVRALKLHGGVPFHKEELAREDTEAINRGFANLQAHIENLRLFGVPVVVAVNRFASDTKSELDLVKKRCSEMDAACGVHEFHAKGSEGNLEVAEMALDLARSSDGPQTPLYPLDLPLEKKIETVAKRLYGADGVFFEPGAARAIKKLTELGYGKLPVCIAKTQASLSDDPKKLGRPKGFTLGVRDAYVSAGAGFVVAIAGSVMQMPGLGKVPAAVGMDIGEDGKITGLF
ncbi:MAG: formate--tetrahydrofolate ligase [Nitrospinota bacterium]